MTSWMSDFGSQARFGSGINFIELQLRQALAATASVKGPDSFRTACVCECLARMPDVVASSALGGLLKVLRQEILRAVYVDGERVGDGQFVDAQNLLCRPTFFTECETLRKQTCELEERLADWQRAKDELAQDSDGRNELLQMALARWNATLASIKAAPDQGGQDTLRKLSAVRAPPMPMRRLPYPASWRLV